MIQAAEKVRMDFFDSLEQRTGNRPLLNFISELSKLGLKLL